MDWEIFWESVRVVVLVILRGEEEKSFIESRREKRRDERMKICGAFGWKEVTTVLVQVLFSKKKSSYDSESKRPFRATNQHFLHIGTSSQNKDGVV